MQTLKDLLLTCTLLREKFAATPTPELSDQLRALEERLQASQRASAEYAAMARAFLGQVGKAGAGS